MCMGTYGGQRHCIPLELESQVVAKLLIWVLGTKTQVFCKNSIHAALTASPLSIPTQCVLDQGCSSVPWSSFRCMTLETVFELGNSTPHILVSWTRAMHFLMAVDFEIRAQQLKVSVSSVSGWPLSHCIQSGSFSSPSKNWN